MPTYEGVATENPAGPESCGSAHDRAERLAEKLVDGRVVDPPYHDDEILLRRHEHQVRPVPYVPERAGRGARHPLPSRTEEPVHVAIRRLRNGGREGEFHPLLGENAL